MRKLPNSNRNQTRALLLAGTAILMAASSVWAAPDAAEDGKTITVKGERAPYNP